MRVLRALTLGVGLAALGMASAGWAEGWQSGHPGQTLYAQHCAGCHGLHGEGDGARVAELRAPPPDLTRLATRYGSPLPLAGLLHHVVDPRRAGGPRICGNHDRWWADHGYGIALERRGTVFSVLAFLGTVQSPRDGASEREPTR